MGLGRVIVQCSRNTTQQELSDRSSVCWWPKTSSSSRNWNSLWIPFQCAIFSQILQRRRFHSNLWKQNKMDPWTPCIWRDTTRAMQREDSPTATGEQAGNQGEEGDTGSRVTRRRVTRGKGPSSDVSWGNPIRNHASRLAASREVSRIRAVDYYSCQLSGTNEIAAIFARSRCSGENG